MPRTGNDDSNISFDAQGPEMIVTVFHKQLLGSLYDHASHRLKPDEIRELRAECDKCLAAEAAKGEDHG